MIYQGSAQYPVHEVILHTAAVTPAWLELHPSAQEQFAAIKAMHTSPGWQGSPNGWFDIGYHYLAGIDMATGRVRIIRGRSNEAIGAHVKERNRGTLGICMINVHQHRGVTRFEDYFTEAQRSAVKRLIEKLAEQTELKWVTGHNDYAPKECPGFKVVSSEWMPSADPARFSWLWGLLRRFGKGSA